MKSQNTHNKRILALVKPITLDCIIEIDPYWKHLDLKKNIII